MPSIIVTSGVAFCRVRWLVDGKNEIFCARTIVFVDIMIDIVARSSVIYAMPCEILAG